MRRDWLEDLRKDVATATHEPWFADNEPFYITLLLADYDRMHEALARIARGTTLDKLALSLARKALVAVDGKPEPTVPMSSEERLAQRVADILVERCAILVRQPGESVRKRKAKR